MIKQKEDASEPTLFDIYKERLEELQKDAKQEALKYALNKQQPTIKELIEFGDKADDKELVNLIATIRPSFGSDNLVKKLSRPKGTRTRQPSEATEKLDEAVLEAIKAGKQTREAVITYMIEDGFEEINLHDKSSLPKVSATIQRLQSAGKIRVEGVKRGAKYFAR